MDKINVFRIVRDHLSTFRRFDTDSTSYSDYVVFFGIPIVVAVVAAAVGFKFAESVLNSLLSAFSIFAGLLLNLLVLVCGFTGNDRFSGYDAASTTRRKFLREIHQNLSFAILVSIFIVLAAMLGLFRLSYAGPYSLPAGHILVTIGEMLVSSTVSFLIANFVLTLLMVLKRIHYLLSFEFSGPKSNKKTA